MDSMPILHANQIFTIHFEEDLAFSAVRSILDDLLRHEAFTEEAQHNRFEYLIDVEEASFHVWVWELNVAIQRR
jgi:hypothetical protein